jgi:protein-tyrosine phosphatase
MINKISHIVNNLYLSGYVPTQNDEYLKYYNIQAIIGLGYDSDNREYRNIKEYAKKNQIERIYIDIADHPSSNIEQYFNITSSVIDKWTKQNKNVLIHCMAGVSRSVTILCAYIIYKNPYLTIDYILENVSLKRPIVNPNPGFIHQLERYKQYLI